MIIKVNTAEELRALRYLSGLTSEMMCKLCGLSLTTYNQIELKKREISEFESMAISAAISDYPHYNHLQTLFTKIDIHKYLSFIENQIVGNRRSFRVAALFTCSCGETDGKYITKTTPQNYESLFIRCDLCGEERQCHSASHFRLIALSLGVLDPLNPDMYDINLLRNRWQDAFPNLAKIIGTKTVRLTPHKERMSESFGTPNEIIAFRVITTFSTQQIADKFDFSNTTIRNLEHGKSPIRLATRLAYYYLYLIEVERRPHLTAVFNSVDSDSLVDLLLDINNGKVPMTTRPTCEKCNSDTTKITKVYDGYWARCTCCGFEWITFNTDAVRRMHQLDQYKRINMFSLKWYRYTIEKHRAAASRSHHLAQ